MHVYEIHPRKDKRGFDLTSDVLPFGRLWLRRVGCNQHAKLYSRSRDAVIPVYEEAGNMIETHEHGGDFREP
jgi:hypothetical protein